MESFNIVNNSFCGLQYQRRERTHSQWPMSRSDNCYAARCVGDEVGDVYCPRRATPNCFDWKDWYRAGSPFFHVDMTEINARNPSSWILTGDGPYPQPYPSRKSSHFGSTAVNKVVAEASVVGVRGSVVSISYRLTEQDIQLDTVD
ncbi:hypothetical protein J6590_061680 [Homalodisca vitripennis]|nr:hypothetical protein J6590_061680 [Homalodisca vitripennis]